MPSSTRSPCASRKTAWCADLGAGSRPSIDVAIWGAFGPETRTIPMPPRPAGVAIAAIVSAAGSPLCMGRLVAIEQALDLPLLKDGKDVVDQPVEHQSRREEEEEHAEDEGH